MRNALNPDLFVTPGPDFVNRTFRFPEALSDQIAATPGVAEVQRVWMSRVPFRGSVTLIFSAEAASLERRARLRAIEGDPRTMYGDVAQGKGALISENFVNLYGVHAGDTIQLPGPEGMVPMKIIGVVEDYSDQQGSLLIDRALMKRIWKDSSVNVIRVYAQPGIDARALRNEINRRFGSQTRLYVMTNPEVRAYITSVTDQWFGITYVQIAVAVLVAILGIVNSLIVSITDRRRELGVLQAVGGLRAQIRRTIWLEAAAIGLIGLLLGLAFGAISLVYNIELGRRDLGGFRLEYLYPLGVTLALVPLILLTAWLSSLGPAESAVRASLVESLEYE
jgi:putative ABC transport system permease protein